jgi:hypothetical protein
VADGYTINALSESGTTFTMTKSGGLAPTRSCDDPGNGGCPSGGATDW